MVVTPELPSPALLLIRPRNPPAGWAIPGGFVEPDEDLIDAARRELHEETALEPPDLKHLATFGHPDRDPCGRTISVVYGARLQHAELPTAGDDAAAARCLPLNALPADLAFGRQSSFGKPKLLSHLANLTPEPRAPTKSEPANRQG